MMKKRKERSFQVMKKTDVCNEPSLCEKWATVLRNMKIEIATATRIPISLFCGKTRIF